MSSANVRLQHDVLGSTIAFREAGSEGAPVALFLHGNPTSSFIWRDVMAAASSAAHCIAPDLIGFGQSGKPDIEYRVGDHLRYIEAFLDARGIQKAYVVAQDWGTALALLLAQRRPSFAKGIALMEYIRPLASWDEFHQMPAARELFQKFRTPGIGEALILEANVFIERVLPGSIVRKLTDEEWATYRAPFPTVDSRRPIWRLPNELPVAGQPADVHALLTDAWHAFEHSPVQKLLFAGNPGALVSPAEAQRLSDRLRCPLVQLATGAHYLQEDHPHTIGSAVARWIDIAESGQTLARAS